MADKSFGVKDINLIGASGTPEIESPNNLNINAVNVAISTDMSVGGTVTVGTGATISSPGSNILTLGVNNTERLRVNSSGVDVTGSVVSDAGTLGSNGNGSRTVSTSDPSGGSDGDVWYKV